MERTERQYEQMARWLDGETVVVSDELLAVAEGIRRDEQALRTHLDVPVPTAAMDRARRRMSTVLASPAARVRRLFVAAGVVAAAAAVIAAVLLWPSAPDGAPTRTIVQEPQPLVPAEVVVKIYTESATDPALSLLASEIDALEAEMAMAVPQTPVDLEIEVLQRDIDDLLVDETLPVLPEDFRQPS